MLDCKPVRRFVYTVYNNGSCVHLPSGIFLMKFGYSFNAFPENIQ